MLDVQILDVQIQEPSPNLSLKERILEDLKMPYHASLVLSMVMAHRCLQGLKSLLQDLLQELLQDLLQIQLDPEVLEEVEVPNCHALYRAPYHDHL